MKRKLWWVVAGLVLAVCAADLLAAAMGLVFAGSLLAAGEERGR